MKTIEQIIIDAGGKNVRCYRVDVTPQLAAGFRSKVNESRQRPISHPNVRKYVKQIQKGEWKFTGQGIIFSNEDELLDGQHRLKAVEISGETISMMVVLGIDAEAWNKMDCVFRRSGADFISSLCNRHSVAAALRLIASEEEGADGDVISSQATDATPGDTPILLEKHPMLVATEKGDNKIHSVMGKLRHIGVPSSIGMYAVYRTILHDSDLADMFWEGVYEGAGLEKNDPRFKLRETMIRASRTPAGRLHQNVVLAYIIKAWNSFAARRLLGSLKWGYGEVFPIWIDGRAPWLNPRPKVVAIKATR